MFVRAREVRTPGQWFTPLERCDRDNYAYEREPGYFLLAIWAIDYVIAIVAGVTVLLLVLFLTDWSTTTMVTLVVIAMVTASMLGARKAKGIFLAVDLAADPLDPHRGEGVDRGPMT